MTTYNLGRIGLNLCGSFDATVNYSKLDVVNFNGSSYVAMEDCIGISPDQEQNDSWMLLAEGMNNNVQEMVLSFENGSKFAIRSDNPLAPTLRVAGHVVELHAELQPTAAITGSTTYYPICTIPEEYAPHHDVCVLQQGSSQQIWMLRIYNRNHETYPGKVMFARCRSGASWSDVSTSTWLPLHATWIV